jgi:hypothetical protein
MGRFLAVLPFLLTAALVPNQAAARTSVDLVLALAVDVSLSIDETEARLQREGYIAAFRDPAVIGAIGSGMLGRIAVGYFEWAGDGSIRVVADWTLVEGRASAHAFADILRRASPSPAFWTSISGALSFALPWLRDNAFEGTREVIDISGDGPNNSGARVTAARDAAIGAGVTINGLPILDDGMGPNSAFYIEDLDLFYRNCVIGGPGAFLVVAKNFTDFGRAIKRKLILEIANRAPPPRTRIVLASGAPPRRLGPPCTIGEQIRLNFDID